MTADALEKFHRGLQLLKKPVLPLVRIVQLLYLTGPFERIAQILDELKEPIETATAVYENPQALLKPYLPVLAEFERLKHPAEPDYVIVTDDNEPVDAFESLQLRVAQLVLTRELEEINSLLCAPCKCVLCCIGPEEDMGQHFFEIPLADQEVALFDFPKVDTPESRAVTSSSEPALSRDGLPFYETESAVYHWQNGWSLILGRGACCPNLDRQSGGCRIYPDRPEVCRRPQIFPYVLERFYGGDSISDGSQKMAYVKRNKILAIWDCPYVRQLKEKIAEYAELCDLEPVFKKNKS